MDNFNPLGAVAINLPILIPLDPDFEFKHISVHVIHILARMMAREAVRAQLRAEGVRARFVLPREINERATTYLAQHPEVWKEAIARAHRLDDAEGQRKARQKLRREELRRRRPVT
jgi:hypothetical protein